MMPSQNDGVAMPSTAMAPDRRSMIVPRYTAARRPSGIAMTTAPMSASGTSVSVLGSRSKKTSTAGLR